MVPGCPGVEFFKIQARGLERRLSKQAGSALWQNGLGLVQTLRIVGEFRPHLILGTGGYASFAPLFWGTLLGIPTLIHEQNVIPGLVNRILAPWVDCVLLAYPETARSLRAKRVVATGVPLRSSIVTARDQLTSSDAKRLFKLDAARPMVLVMGGSHGARALHEQLLSGRELLHGERIQVVIIAGRDTDRLRADLSPCPLSGSERGAEGGVRSGILILEHTSEIGALMKAADLVVCRAGGATLAELTALGKPAILVPWPGATDEHQERNARWLAERGACRLVLEDQLTDTQLVEEILNLLCDEACLHEMSTRSAHLGRANALNHVIREVESYLDYAKRSRIVSLHRNRRGWDERLSLGAPRARPSRQRLGS